MITVTIILLIIAIATLLYYVIRRRYSYWARTNVPYIKAGFPFGNVKGIMQTVNAVELMQQFYNKMKGRGSFGGIHIFHNPVVLALDIDFIKKILIKDFNYFNHRGFYCNERDDPLGAHLFTQSGKKWIKLREKITTTFTSGQMKFMFPTLAKVAKQLEECLSNLMMDNVEQIIDVKEIIARFTTDVISTCAFGIDCNSLSDPNAQFRIMGKKVFEEPRVTGLHLLFMLHFRNLAKFLRMKMTHDDVAEFFMDAVKTTVKTREENNIQRKDFMDLLIKLMRESNTTELGNLTINEVAAQAFVFFLAGFETSSATTTFCLYELSLNPYIQEQVRDEINRVIKEHNNEFTYEAMNDMTYLEQVIKETLRKYPPIGNLIREVTKDYYVADVNHTIPKGTQIIIPAHAIQRDPEFYPEPEKFDPNRFSPEQSKLRNQLTYLPFGDGQRNCIGQRFGLMQIRFALITLLRNYNISLGPNTKVPLKLSITSPVAAPAELLYIKLTRTN